MGSCSQTMRSRPPVTQRWSPLAVSHAAKQRILGRSEENSYAGLSTREEHTVTAGAQNQPPVIPTTPCDFWPPDVQPVEGLRPIIGHLPHTHTSLGGAAEQQRTLGLWRERRTVFKDHRGEKLFSRDSSTGNTSALSGGTTLFLKHVLH